MFAAFNEHDSEKLMSFFAEDLEFYHDKGGLAGHAETRKGFENLFAANKSTGLRRDIVPGTLEVYPINDFGAVETCQHRFCHKENGKDDCGTFKNTMIWKKTEKGWKVTRVISYDH
jgi:ketosteroid isomerase-like protein